MKKSVLFLAITMVSMTMSFAQQKEGHISYDIEMSSDNPEMEAAISMFNESSMELFFSEEMSRTELSFGAIMSVSTIVDNNTDEVLILMEGMMGNKAAPTNSEEMNADGENVPETTITITDEEKLILDYTCKKAVVKDSDGNEIEFWFTENISPNTINKADPLSQLPGLALEYSVNQSGMKMSFTAREIATEIDASTKTDKLNLTIPEGFDEITYDEFTSMGGM